MYDDSLKAGLSGLTFYLSKELLPAWDSESTAVVPSYENTLADDFAWEGISYRPAGEGEVKGKGARVEFRMSLDIVSDDSGF